MPPNFIEFIKILLSLLISTLLINSGGSCRLSTAAVYSASKLSEAFTTIY